MFYSDYHIHSRFSGDCNEDLDEIIKKSIGLGLREIAITDHFEKDMINLSKEWDIDLNKYSEEILRLKEKYRKEIEIKLGLEVGIQYQTIDFFEKELKKYPLDFVIASSHGIDRYDLSVGVLQEGKTRDEMQDLYFRTVLKNVENYKKFNVYGHLDFVTRYGGAKFRGMNIENHMDVIEKILKGLIDKGKGIEINTSGYRYGENRVYPDFDIIKKYFDLGGEIITIGSDSHRKDDITKDFKVAYEILEKLGVKYISSFEKMEPSFIKIK